MRRVALLLAALLLLGLLASAGAADAKPRKKQRALRGHVTRQAAALPAGFWPVVAPAPAPAPGGGPATPPGDVPADPPAEPPPPPPPPLPTGSGRALQVRTDDSDLTALKLALSRTTVLAGTVKVTLNNAYAQDPHNLVLEPLGGGAGETFVFPELAAGGVDVRQVPLAAGDWKLYCGLDGHEALGMSARLTVD